MYILVYIWAFVCGFTFAVDFQESSKFTFLKLMVILFSPILLLFGYISVLAEIIWTRTILWFLWEIYVTKDKNWYDFNADKLPRLIEQMQLHHGFLFTWSVVKVMSIQTCGPNPFLVGDQVKVKDLPQPYIVFRIKGNVVWAGLGDKKIILNHKYLELCQKR